MYQKPKKGIGFPNYFKKIGLLIILISIFFPVFKMFSIEIPIKQEVSKMIFFDLIIIGLCMIILSKDKVEDEMTFQLKLKEFLSSFIFVVSYFIIKPIIDLLVDGTVDKVEAQYVIFFMCFTHLATHYMNKWIIIWNERNNKY